MVTSSHAWLTWRLARGRPGAGWAVAGSVLPDVPAWVSGAVHRRRGLRGRALLDAVYERPPSREVQRAAHSVPLALACGLAGPRALAAGWLGHLAVDAVSHHDDAWPLLWPVTGRAWPSPVSYWQRDHHATAWQVAQAAALALAARRDPAARAALVAALVASVSWPPRISAGGAARGGRRRGRPRGRA